MYNVYKQFGEELKPYLEQGFLPALFLDRASSMQFWSVKRLKMGSGVHPKDLLFVPVEEIDDEKAPTKTSYVLLAKDEKQAIDVFRRRVGYLKFLENITSTGDIPRILGIDADGEIRPSRYVPMLKVGGAQQEDLEYILAVTNKAVARLDRGEACGVFDEKGNLNLSYCLRAELTTAKDIKSARKVLLNTVYSKLSSTYDVERLDDRGGTNVENISIYVSKAKRPEFLAQSVISKAVECTDSSLAEVEKGVQNEKSYN